RSRRSPRLRWAARMQRPTVRPISHNPLPVALDSVRVLPPAAPLAAARGRDLVDVEVTIPVHNEQRVLEGSVRRLHAYLERELPLSWRIVIADNASTDRTAA